MKYEERLTKKIRGYYHGKRFVGGKGVINDGKYYRGCFDATAIVDRLGELEDKIERGELVEVPKGVVVLTPEERKQAVREFLKLLKEKESPKLLMWEYGEGYLDCIKTAEELAAQYGVEVEE